MKRSRRRKHKESREPIISTPTSKSFSHQELLDALYEFQREMETAMVTFFLVGSTLQSAINEMELTGDTLYFGVRKKDMTREGFDLLSIGDMKPTSISDELITFEINGIKVHLQIFRDDVAELQRLDNTVYAYESFDIPNPYKSFMAKYGN